MKITEQQLIVLLQTTGDSLSIADGGTFFTFDANTRQRIVQAVINQQTAILETREPLQEPPK